MHRDILTTEEKIRLAQKRGVYTEYELDVLIPAFPSNKEFDKVNREKQNRHIVGTYEYKQADAKSKRLGFAGTAFFDSDFDIFMEIKNIRGTGSSYAPTSYPSDTQEQKLMLFRLTPLTTRKCYIKKKKPVSDSRPGMPPGCPEQVLFIIYNLFSEKSRPL
ncbi:MAG: hypothetical protein IK114_01370 [Fibrobacter sp.]|nr:hypothetical protein [Fibrobacter sp.]